MVEAEVADPAPAGLTRFTDPADGADYCLFTATRPVARRLFCCFDQSDLTATTTLSAWRCPAGWDAGQRAGHRRPPDGRPGCGGSRRCRHGAVRPDPARRAVRGGWRGDGGGGLVRDERAPTPVAGRRGRGGGLGTFGELSRRAIEQYERTLGVPCPYPKYDIGFVPRLDALAVSMPGLMLVNESLLARMADPDDDFVAMVCRARGGAPVVRLPGGRALVGRPVAGRGDGHLPELHGHAGARAWTAFCYREKPAAYRADALPGARTGVLAGGQRDRRAVPACRAHLLQRRRRDQAARRADRRRRAAGRAGRLHAPVRRRQRGAGRPDRLPVAVLRPGPAPAGRTSGCAPRAPARCGRS